MPRIDDNPRSAERAPSRPLKRLDGKPRKSVACGAARPRPAPDFRGCCPVSAASGMLCMPSAHRAHGHGLRWSAPHLKAQIRLFNGKSKFFLFTACGRSCSARPQETLIKAFPASVLHLKISAGRIPCSGPQVSRLHRSLTPQAKGERR